MKESGFWRKLRPLMRAAAPGIVVERIESWSTPGFPDVSGTWKGQDFWLELKIIRDGRVKMRPDQVRWLERRWQAGSWSFILACEPEFGSLFLLDGDRARELSKKRIIDVTHRALLSFDISGVSNLVYTLYADR